MKPSVPDRQGADNRNFQTVHVDELSPQKGWSASAPDSIERLQIVYKIVERCNIDCTYCYYFNMGDNSALERPPLVSLEVAEKLADWIAQGCEELHIPEVLISFHGGEPLLINPNLFDQICTVLRERIAPFAMVEFSVQTNGTIMNDRWMDSIQRNRVAVGVSIDGAKEDHDRYRLDRKKRSTFEKTEDTIRKLVKAAGSDEARLPSTISVLDHQVDYTSTYNYLRGLGVRRMSFLLPDRNADDESFHTAGMGAEFGDRLSELFEAWFSEDDPEIRIRFIDEALRHFLVTDSKGQTKRRRKDVQILTARSDGSIALDDSYIPALAWYSETPTFSVSSSSLRETLANPIFADIEEKANSVPSDCETCRWKSPCRGGDLENRFSKRNGFNNPSVYCEAYKGFYSTICGRLAQKGYPTDVLEERFGFGDAYV